MFFQGWVGIFRTMIVGVSAYFALIILLRISGKRTLSKMNAFDLVITVALGSTLATILLSKDVPLAEGIAGFALLIFLQFVITWLSVRSKAVSRLVKAEPALLFYRGQMLWENMKIERVVENEISAALRTQGFSSYEKIEAVVLETDGSFTVIPQPQAGVKASALQHVSREGAPADE
jgi:uncharacterized membrane protein YcaP (DUF421 family)